MTGAAGPLLVGVDTGGTCTDAAVLDAGTRAVVATAKAVTTRGDLSVGIVEALTGALSGLPDGRSAADVRLVSVSTTLATNAVVEGHGGRVGVVLVGFDEAMAERTGIARAFPGTPIARVDGGHDHAGDERSPLDVAALSAELARFGDVEAVAIASAFAVRNPAHEHQAREIVVGATGLPVTISTELTSELDAPRRALTAVLNARLIAKISALLEAVGTAARRLGIVCPLMVMKGDGSLALADQVAHQPIETILSGPAASVVGTAWLSGLDSFVMSDIGGTTTDIALWRDGRPVVDDRGAVVGGWPTMVRAMAVTTTGLGGDSDVVVGPDGSVHLRHHRVIPLSLLATRHPGISAQLRADLADEFMSVLHGRFVVRPFGGGAPGGSAGGRSGLSIAAREILDAVGDEAVPARRVLRASGSQRALGLLVSRGLLQVAAFTPSDAAHVLGLQSTWSAEAARLGALLAARLRRMRSPDAGEAEEVSADVIEALTAASCRAVLEVLLDRRTPDGSDSALMDAIAAGHPQVGLARLAVTPVLPVVAVGGPAPLVYPEAGRRLGTQVRLPGHGSVANAVGAATAAVCRSVTVHVEAHPAGGGFTVHGPAGVTLEAGGAEAIAEAESQARAAAHRAVMESGGAEPRVEVRTLRHLLPGATDDRGLLAAVVTAEALASPATIEAPA
jgi:N-methylhydantoinase A/oxoprolinase/acetone carboxylase beta subunit